MSAFDDLIAKLTERNLSTDKVDAILEAGENLGYLPGDLKEKVDPHFRPLYDSLQDFIGLNKFEQFITISVS